MTAIRDERSGDEAAIGKVIDRAFALAKHRDGTEAGVVERLRAAGALTLSLVAEIDDAIVGHVAFSPVVIDGASDWFGLGPVAVDPARQGEGIGAALIERGLARLRDDGAAGCVVLGNPVYYARFGFRADPRLRYPLAPPIYFQALAFGDEVPAGEVKYHAAFG